MSDIHRIVRGSFFVVYTPYPRVGSSLLAIRVFGKPLFVVVVEENILRGLVVGGILLQNTEDSFLLLHTSPKRSLRVYSGCRWPRL